MAIHKSEAGRGIHQPGQFQITNSTVDIISKGTVVKIVGYELFTSVAPVDNPTSNDILGVIVDDVAGSANGYVARMGVFNQFDTSAWTPGTVLYSDSSGALTTVVSGPIIGTVRRQSVSDGVMHFDVRSSSVAPGSGGYQSTVTTILQTDINNGYINLSSTPASPTETIVLLKSAPSQVYGDDFTVVGNQLNFISTNPGDLGSILTAGDKITIMFK